jgi:hypothetical protein
MFETVETTFRCKQGDAFMAAFQLQANQQAVSLEDWTAEFCLPTSDPLVSLTLGAGLTWSPDFTVIAAVIPSTVTSGLLGLYHFWLRLTDPAGNPGTPLNGDMIFTAP